MLGNLIRYTGLPDSLRSATWFAASP